MSEFVAQPELPDKLLTIPTVGMTIPRAVLGAVIPYRAYRGEPTTVLTVVGALSDMEGHLARGIDAAFPDAELGCSKQGQDLDYKADFAFGLGGLAGMLIAKDSHPASRLAAVVGGAKQVSQANWAIRAGLEYKAATGKDLRTKVGMTGKLATSCLLGSIAASTISRDLKKDGGNTHRGLAYASLGLAVAATVLGKKAERENTQQYRTKIAALETSQ
jgi:hypothetical protein